MQRPITVSGGRPMPGWFDVFELGSDSMDRKEDAEGIADAAACAPGYLHQNSAIQITFRATSALLCLLNRIARFVPACVCNQAAQLAVLHPVDRSAGQPCTCRFVSGLIKQELDAGLPADRAVVGGFSQGGSIALHALRQPQKLAGVIGTFLFPVCGPARLPHVSRASVACTPREAAHSDAHPDVGCDVDACADT